MNLSLALLYARPSLTSLRPSPNFLLTLCGDITKYRTKIMLILTWPRFPLLFMENKCLISFCLTPSYLLPPYPLAPCKTVATLLWFVTVPKSHWWPVCSWLRLPKPLWGSHVLCCPPLCRTVGTQWVAKKEGKVNLRDVVRSWLRWPDWILLQWENKASLWDSSSRMSQCVFQHKKYALLYKYVSLGHPLCLKTFNDSLLPKGVQASVARHSRLLTICSQPSL